MADQGIQRVPTLMTEEKKDLDPYYRCGRRKALAKLLGQITRDQDDAEAVKFEIMASVKKDGGCLLHGVCVTDYSVAVAARRESGHRNSVSLSMSQQSVSMSASTPTLHFMAQQRKIEKAVFTAFKIGTELRDLYVFTVTVSEMAQSTREEEVKLVLSGLKRLKADKHTIKVVKDDIGDVKEDDYHHEAEDSELQGLLRNVSENELIDESNDEFIDENACRRGSIL